MRCCAQTLFPATDAPLDLRGEHLHLRSPEPALAMLNPDDEPHSCRGKVRSVCLLVSFLGAEDVCQYVLPRNMRAWW